MSVICTLKNGNDQIWVQDDGGMVTGEFELDGQNINPFYSHPWEESEVESGLLKFLKGDFFCAPFGITPSRDIPGFSAEKKSQEKEYAHGLSSNGRWSLKENNGDHAQIHIDYPNSCINGVNRTISFMQDKKGILFKNEVFVNKDVSLPIGAHPILRLPDKPGAAKLVVPDTKMLYTYPIKTDETSIVQTDTMYNDLSETPLRDGGSIDLTSLPLDCCVEEIVMLCDVGEGVIQLENREEGYRAVLEFDHTKVPNCLLWISNRGRQFEPWNGRNLCLGIEPIAAAFDFGTDISSSDNKLNQNDIKTCVSITKEQPFVFEYKIYVEAL